MFSRFLQIPKSYLAARKPSKNHTVTPQAPDEQLLAELQQDAEASMVATRSQDHTLDDVEVQDIIEHGTLSDEILKKRTSVDRTEIEIEPTLDSKRRRTLTIEEDDTAALNSAEDLQVDPEEGDEIPTSHKSQGSPSGDAVTEQDATQKSLSSPTTSLAQPLNKSKAYAGVEVMTGVVITPKVTLTQHRRDNENVEGSMISTKADQIPRESTPRDIEEPQPDRSSSRSRGRPRRMLQGRIRESIRDSLSNSTASDEIPDAADIKRTSSTIKQSKHKRFGSEDRIILDPMLEVESIKHGSDNEPLEDSDDEAPETVTVSAEKLKARIAADEAERAVAKQEAIERVKRREKDLRLKLQAKSSKRHSWLDEQLSAKIATAEAVENISLEATTTADKPSPIGIPETDALAIDTLEPTTNNHIDSSKTETTSPETATLLDSQSSPTNPKHSHKPPLPKYLPAELLAAAPPPRLPTPPPSAKTKLQTIPLNKKRKFVDLVSKPPKDVKVGNTKVRVLQDLKTALPPRASLDSKALRESWLMGRRGLNGALVVPRRKVGGGFVRRR